MPCVVCREVVVGAVCATVHATDDYLRWAPATAPGPLPPPMVTWPDRQTRPWPNPNRHTGPVSKKKGDTHPLSCNSHVSVIRNTRAYGPDQDTRGVYAVVVAM